jgi:hypothetical protein
MSSFSMAGWRMAVTLESIRDSAQSPNAANIKKRSPTQHLDTSNNTASKPPPGRQITAIHTNKTASSAQAKCI